MQKLWRLIWCFGGRGWVGDRRYWRIYGRVNLIIGPDLYPVSEVIARTPLVPDDVLIVECTSQRGNGAVNEVIRGFGRLINSIQQPACGSHLARFIEQHSQNHCLDR